MTRVPIALLALAGPATACASAFGPAQALDLRVTGPLAARAARPSWRA